MTQKRDGGPAFPVPQMVYPKDGAPHYIIDGGLSIRDWFAGQALPGIINGFVNEYGHLPETQAQWEGCRTEGRHLRRPHDVQPGGEMIQNLYHIEAKSTDPVTGALRLYEAPELFRQGCTPEELITTILTLQSIQDLVTRAIQDDQLELRVRMEQDGATECVTDAGTAELKESKQVGGYRLEVRAG